MDVSDERRGDELSGGMGVTGSRTLGDVLERGGMFFVRFPHAVDGMQILFGWPARTDARPPACRAGMRNCLRPPAS